jgi:uncharacterized protein
MKANLAAFAAGLVFAIGLCIAGMTLPSKIVGFLDFAGQWDASLAFVIGGAVAVYAVIYRWAARQESPLFVPKFSIPSRNDIDGSLVGMRRYSASDGDSAVFVPALPSPR